MGSVTESEVPKHRIPTLARLDRPRSGTEAKLLQSAGVRYGYRCQRQQAKQRKARAGGFR
jgi:hypothetical protein